ncbi:MAG: tyrosine--tRNA ligase [Patescibacteria group bacterium]|nr:tyrosine--tRNA ligase [Patescibacteria group bacterium]
MIGDPTDKLAARKKLTREEVSKNSKDYKKQASGCLKFDGDNPAKIMHNSEWSDKLDFRSLIELASNFTVQQMITRDMFQKRIREEKPIFLHEFLYPLAQGYDSLMLDVDLEVGGNDQMFNMLCGRDLLKALRGKEKYVMTLKLLADEKGKKMGKSEGNAVFLDQEPEDMYGKIMSWPDEILGVGFELCTRLPMPEVNDIRKELTKGKVNPRDLKMKLAYAVVKLIYDTEAAKKAEDSFIKLFQKKDIMNNVDIPFVNNMPELNMNIINVVSICAGISKSDARRLVKQGGIKYNGKPITSIEEKICLTGEVLEVGKKKFFKPRHGG